MSSSRYLVFGGEIIPATLNRAGGIERNEQHRLWHLSLAEDKKVFYSDLYGTKLNLSSFKYPAIYDLKKIPDNRQNGKSGALIIKSDFVQTIKFKKEEGFVISYLREYDVDYDKLPRNLKERTTKTGKASALKVLGINLYKDVDFGYAPLDESIVENDEFSIDDLKEALHTVPAYYDLTFDDLRNSEGENLVSIVSADYEGDLDINVPTSVGV